MHVQGQPKYKLQSTCTELACCHEADHNNSVSTIAFYNRPSLHFPIQTIHGDSSPAVSGTVGRGVPREGFSMVCIPRFWVD